jgi:hypothetical protein
MATPSRRSLLLEHAVRDDPIKGGRVCVECNAPFAPGSDSATWHGHWKSFHASKLSTLLSPLSSSQADDVSVADADDLLSQPSKKRKVLNRAPASSSRQTSLATLFGTTGSAKAQASLARLLTRGSLGYNMVTWPEFKEFLSDVGWTVCAAHGT